MQYFILVILWIAFCFLHSALVSTTVTEFLKKRIGGAYRFYRLFYNIFSIITLLPAIIYSWTIKQDPFFVWEGYLLPIKYLLFLTGIIFFVLGAQHYSFAQISGLARIKEGAGHNLISKTGQFSERGIMGAVRHPFYAGIFPILWASDLDPTALIINIILSIYVVIGTLLEERKLILEFGDAYRAYQQRVSMLFPWKWIIKKLRINSA